MADFFPWAVLLPSAIWLGWRESRRSSREAVRFLLFWIVGTVIFFSLSPSKRSVYVLPMFPALALVVGHGLDLVAANTSIKRRWIVLPLTLLAALSAAAVFVVPSQFANLKEAAVLGSETAREMAWLAGALLLGAAGSAMLAARRSRRTAVPLVLAMLATSGAAFSYLVPKADVLKSVRPVTELLQQKLSTDEPFGVFPFAESSVLFYMQRTAQVLHTEEELRAFAEAGGRWVVASRLYLQPIQSRVPYDVVAGDARSKRGVVLLRAREPTRRTARDPG